MSRHMNSSNAVWITPATTTHSGTTFELSPISALFASVLLIALAGIASLSAFAQESSSVQSYPDGRPTAEYRLDAGDAGRIFKHGSGPDKCDALGAREASVVLHDGVYHLFYDGAEPGVGWLACLATSKDLKNWQRHGPVFSYGEPGTLDPH